MNNEMYRPSESYMRVAAARPEVVVADVSANIANIATLYDDACDQKVSLVTFPELSITGYTIGDLVRQNALLQQAQQGLRMLAEHTGERSTAMVVGLPLRVGNALFNCAAVLAEGKICGIVPKQHLPTYGEFYEKRWYQSGQDVPTQTIEINGQNVPFGTDLLFDIGGVNTGIEICEDLWVTDPPSRQLAEHGALVIANPSASPELVGKAAYRRQLITSHAARLICGYVYAGCDQSESTMDIVMGGHQLISENGRMLAERKPFGEEPRLLVADIDIDRLRHDRLRDTNYPNRMDMQIVHCLERQPDFTPNAQLPADPFLPAHESPHDRAERLGGIINIAATGLAERLRHSNIPHIVLGLSGGLDSTLALLLAHRAAQLLQRDPADMIHTLTMPGMASSDRTQNNAQLLAKGLGVANRVVPIEDIAAQELAMLQHDGTQDITYENVQARARTELLFNYANMHGGLVQGTGDLSESLLGWCTYNGDHMSHYNPNATIPKTLVRHLVRYMAEQDEFADVRAILEDIVDTPVSPELTRDASGEISQKTEDIVGPYVLHEFFATALIRWGDAPSKIRFLAGQTFAGMYEPDEIDHWFGIFVRRFIGSQHKRSVMPDGPKVGSVALSPRGDWRMPSDVPTTAIWK